MNSIFTSKNSAGLCPSVSVWSRPQPFRVSGTQSSSLVPDRLSGSAGALR